MIYDSSLMVFLLSGFAKLCKQKEEKTYKIHIDSNVRKQYRLGNGESFNLAQSQKSVVSINMGILFSG